MKAPNGMGTSGAAKLPPPLSFWNSGGYWFDLPTSLVSSAASARVLTAVGAPAINNTAMGGNPAYALTGTQSFDQNALAALFDVTKSFTVAIRCRTTSTALQSMWGAGYDFNTEKCLGQLSAQFPVLQSDTPLPYNATRTSDVSAQFDDSVIVISYDATAPLTKIWINGVLTSATNSAAPLPSYAVYVLTLFKVGGWPAATLQQPFFGYIKRFAASSSSISDSQAVGLTAAWGPATDYTLPLAASPKVLQAGDSLTVGENDATGLGYRGNMANLFTIPNRLSLCNIGQFNTGPFPNNANSAAGGATADLIATNALAAMAASGVPTSLLMVMAGTNDIVAVGVPAALVSYQAMLQALETAGRARNAEFRMAVSSIPPIKPATSGAALVDPYNAGLIPIWDAYDIAHPATPLLRANVNAALSPWSLTNFSNDVVGNVHPNATGYALMWSAGWLPAVSSYLLALGAGHQ